MAKKAENKKTEVKKQSETIDKVLTLGGELRKNENEDLEIDYEGSISFDKPGEYWLDGFMKKDERGIFVGLVPRLKDTQTERKPNEIIIEDGVLYRNNRKKFRNQPDYTGTFTISNPGEYSITGSILVSKQQTNYMKLNIVQESEFTEDDLPF